MSYPPSVQQVIARVNSLSADINLKLPASPAVIGQQVMRIAQAQNELEVIEDDLLNQLAGSYRLTTRQPYIVLLRLVRHLYRHADSLMHLADEFPIDPEGSIACLENLKSEKTHWTTQFVRFSEFNKTRNMQLA
ncbi:MAG TPA: hypothetical protein V6C88_18165 [Chroococcidiopsis sp.]